MIPLKVELEIPHFQRVTTTVFGQTAGKVRDRVDELVRNVEQQLGDYRVIQYSWVGRCKEASGLTSSTSGSIFTLGSILDTKSWMDLRILWSPAEFFLRGARLSSRFNISSVPLVICAGDPVKCA